MIRVLGAVLLAAAAAGCAPSPSPSPPPAGTAVTVSASATPAITRAVPTPPAPLPSAALPDRTLTPGAAGSSLAEICPHVSTALEAARPDAAMKAAVYAEYSIPPARRHLFRIDHLDPLALDGQNVMANLWPQPLAESLRKDKVEDALHAWVCAAAGAAAQARLGEAQAAISHDWTAAETVLGIGRAS